MKQGMETTNLQGKSVRKATLNWQGVEMMGRGGSKYGAQNSCKALSISQSNLGPNLRSRDTQPAPRQDRSCEIPHNRNSGAEAKFCDLTLTTIFITTVINSQILDQLR